MKRLTVMLGIVLSLNIGGCSVGEDNPGVQSTDENEVPSTSVTQWTDKMELFMEYPLPVKSSPGKFVIHLSLMEDFKAIQGGTVSLTFQHQNGQTFQVKRDHLLREGIFNPMVELPLAGPYAFTLNYNGPRASETFQIDDFMVYESADEIPKEPESGAVAITFLKEQQWKIKFRTEPAQVRPMRGSIQAIGEVLPRQLSYAEITSPVEGVLRVEHNQGMVIPGAVVKKGQILATFSPQLGSVDSWIDRKLAYEYAKTEYERAQRLKQKNAISNREFEELKNNYLIQKAGYEAYTQSDNSDLFQLRAPIDGTVTEVTILPGQKISAGQKLMTIVNLSTVWLRINLFEKDYYRMETPVGAALTVPGLKSAIILEGRDFRLLSMGNVVDADTRTIPILLEIANRDHVLKIGQMTQVELYTTRATRSLSIPESALYDDDAQQIVFVHAEGESFEKRTVETGSRYRGWISILSGLKAGERVVTQGGYLVKLASTSKEIGHGHAH